MKIDHDTLYVPKEVAEILRCSKSNVYELAARGVIASIRVCAGGGGIRFRGSDILAFLGDTRREATEPRKKFSRLGL